MTLTHDDAPSPSMTGASPAPTTSTAQDPRQLTPPPPPARRRRVRPPARFVALGDQRRADGPWRAGRRSPGHRARKVLRPNLRWRVLVATVGAFVLTVCSGMALGVVSISSSGVDLRFRDAPQAPPVVTGTDGVHPGGAARSIALTVQNTAGSAFEITSVAADLTGLPDECPAAAWQVGVPGLLPTVPARSEVTVPLPVTLRPEAPDSCQGRTVRFPVRIDGLRHPRPVTNAVPAASPPPSSVGAAGAQEPAETLRPERLDATATVTAARLGTPSGAAAVPGGQVEITPGRPASGPAPTGYDVARVGPGGHRTTVCRAVATCTDRGLPAAAPLTYVVTARLGTHWTRDSSPVRTWTPPPAPSLAFADDDRPAPSALVLRAVGGVSGYDVSLHADDLGTPFHSAHVAAGGSIDQTVPAPDLGPGTHRLVAIARYRGWRSPSATLRLTISDDGGVTAEPIDDPDPVPGEAGPADPTTDGPPVVSVPTRTTSVPSTRTSSQPRPAAGPPEQTIATSSGPPAEPPPATPVPPPVPVPVPVPVVPNAVTPGSGPPVPTVG